MLNPTRVLEYIKANLAFPFQQLEMEDNDIVRYFTTYTLREFSQYMPEVKKLVLDTKSGITKVPGRSNEYLLEDPDGLEIINVVDVYFSTSDLYIHGHPAFGPFTHGELADWALGVEMAMSTKMFSSFDKTFVFRHPNILRISPEPTDTFVTVEYERLQPADLRGVPNEFQILFCELCLADTQILLGRIRKKYGDGNLRTPFGEIPLGAEIFDEGKEKKREIIEKLVNGTLPNVVLDFG